VYRGTYKNRHGGGLTKLHSYSGAKARDRQELDRGASGWTQKGRSARLFVHEIDDSSNNARPARRIPAKGRRWSKLDCLLGGCLVVWLFCLNGGLGAW
jgi:hypothetical protein